MTITDYAREHWFQSVSNNFGDNLIEGVTKTNGPEVLQTERIVDFRDQAEESLVKLMGDGGCPKNVFAKSDGASTQDIPISLVKEGV